MRFLGLAQVIVLSLAFIGCTKKADNANVVRVGQFGSMTGPEATFGLSTDRGIRLAIDAKNAAGGVKGKQIKLITEDNQGKAEEAAAVVKKLITQDGVVAILGEVASTRSKAAAPIAQANKIPMISPSSTNPDVTKVGDYIFRACFTDKFQGVVMARFAAEHLKLKKVAIFMDMKSDYSIGFTKYFKEKFKELGGEIVIEQQFQSNDSDFKAQLTRIRAENPEAIFLPDYYTDVGLIARQARDLGIKVPLLGGDGWDSPKLFEIGQKAVEGAYFSNHYSTDSKSQATLDFIAAYQKKFGHTPDGMAATGYDAAMILIGAMERSADLKPEQIRDEIAKTKDYDGATGKITINADRDPDKPVSIVQVENKALKLITLIGP